MQLLKCKMCGGDIEVGEEQTYGTCDSCGSVITLPKISDDRRANLFNRANYFRQSNCFDKAITAFERILEEDDSDAEAHWGVALSRYGIEYVEDPKSHERIPTCHRMQNTAILSDLDYLAAVQYAPDGYSRSLYEQEGKRIAELQKKIFAISQREEPYDVFICYRETGESGGRTRESVLAQEIYYELTEMKIQTFFARITLETKLGGEYEPYIFAALGSAQVMLVIGTSPENFSSVWVKNEWSRYLELLKKDRSRQIIPCYRDMDPYDLPEELSIYQSQDMSKLGFMQDLLRGVEKLLGASTTGTDQLVGERDESTDDASIPTFESLTERGELFLEDKEFLKADQYFERALDINPKYARAYIGKLCAALRCQYEKDLAQSNSRLEKHKDFEKAIRFADNETRERLLKYKEQASPLARAREQLEEQEKQKKLEEQKRQKYLTCDAKILADIKNRLEGVQDLPNGSDVIRMIKMGTLRELLEKLQALGDNPEVLRYIEICNKEMKEVEAAESSDFMFTE